MTIKPRRHGPVDRVRILARRHGPMAPVWRKRMAIVSGAVALGLVALLFAAIANQANHLFMRIYHFAWWSPLVVTPLGFVALAWFTRTVAPDSRGSGIPQIIAARHDPDGAMKSLASARTAAAKFIVTIGGLLVGGSVGREGPTVQISATIMAYAHKLFRVPLRASVMVAGGAAGVAAAFNTPIAGVTFAIEELASAYEQRMTLLVITAVIISGMVSLGLNGDYTYFGTMGDTLPLRQVITVTPVAGVIGGLAGGLFARLMLDFGRSAAKPLVWLRSRPQMTALVMGSVVAVIGCASGLTWGTGYEPARLIIAGVKAPVWFGPAKFMTTLATSLSGLPGGIFAPSLAAGAGFGDLLSPLFPRAPVGCVVLLGMAGYFTGVVRAPLTAAIIISEATASRGLLLPLLATALIANSISAFVCKERLYHGLSRDYLLKTREATPG